MFNLKKSFLPIIILVCCLTISANAQLSHFGVKVGLNLANVYGKDVSNSFPNKELKPGLVTGAYMTYDFLPLLSIQPEVLFSMKGTKGSAAATTPYDYTQTFNYIEVPVLLRLNLPLGPAVPFKANILAGPDFAFNVASTDEFAWQGVSLLPNTLDTKSSTKTFDFNLAVGAGAGYDVGPTTLGLELRYTFGTGQLTKSGEGNIRNGVFAIIASAGI